MYGPAFGGPKILVYIYIYEKFKDSPTQERQLELAQQVIKNILLALVIAPRDEVNKEFEPFDVLKCDKRAGRCLAPRMQPGDTFSTETASALKSQIEELAFVEPLTHDWLLIRCPKAQNYKNYKHSKKYKI